jgi:superfamily II DNA or RNA helicase/HKD family nuclease/diadenosine tetraphosphate (Ap4A) HIT family hydrolase
VFYSGERVLGIWDAFPASPGHALLTPRRHVADWFDASPEEQAELLRAVAVAKASIEMEHRPDGYNIGINVGRAAGQTVFHLHVHVIPRYSGDVPDPRGGVRHVIPSKGNYLVARPESIASGTVEPLQSLVRGGSDDPLLPHLIALLDDAVSVFIAAAFTLESGVRLIEEHLRDVLDRGGRVQVVTGDYLGVTEPRALLRLLDLQGDVQLRVFESKGVSFHPKAYIVTGQNGAGTAFVGSSNLTETALQRGIEWNYRVVHSQDQAGYGNIVSAFEQLWQHPSTTDLDQEWVIGYTARRAAPLPRAAGVEPEPVPSPPKPHPVQVEALAALEETRFAGNTAGLVVLATGLGKTWLSAFDSSREEYRRVLFIAHREEILTQAMRTFRTIRPQATLGFYNGSEKTPDADVLFASIQTLGRAEHLHRFDPRHFDYVIVDEFHHAAAQTYRRLIGYVEPKFLLGLTATPERTDGSDLLSLCGDNLIYRCDVAEGIRRDLLAPFDYFGVPDDVDYANIPWRNNRFDENALTTAVATEARAQNALSQYRRLGRTRTVAFCVSQRHADYMANYFTDAGLRSAAVHSGSTSAPRAHSLERLSAGELDVVFAVDMFNEGVDLPNIDTVLMLRPTESRILWLQQFGRGLRRLPGKTLQVIDYIGNHRVFLTKTKALFDLGSSDREVAFALDQLDAGTLELPPGCSVTYQLEAKEILRGLIRAAPQGEQLQAFYERFREDHAARPLAVELYEEGFDPRSVRRSGFSSWLDFVRLMEDFTPIQAAAFAEHRALLEQLEVTPMSKSYKMLVLLAMLGADAFPGSISIEELVRRFGDLARRSAALRSDVGDALDAPAALRRLVESNPVAAWAGGQGTGGRAYFAYADGMFSSTFSVSERHREALQDLTREVAEWRLAAYMRRSPHNTTTDRIICRVIQSNGRPFLKLPDRDRHPGIPSGWQDVIADDRELQANFVKIAVNVVVQPGSDENVLPEVLRGWFGPEAGHPGRTHDVVIDRRGTTFVMGPVTDAAQVDGPVLWQAYTRHDAAAAVGITLVGWEPQSGIIQRPDSLTFFVTLNKDSHADAYQYRDQFLSPTEFQWQSQNKNTRASTIGQAIRHHKERNIAVHLFVRAEAKLAGQTQPFTYCGRLKFVRWEGEKPITVWWQLREAVPEPLRRVVGLASQQPVNKR